MSKLILCQCCIHREVCGHEGVDDPALTFCDDYLSIADVEPVRHGHWIECDYKKLEHGFIEIYPNKGYCCSVCRTAFERRKMTYKQFCAACGAVMDERSDEA